MDSLDKPPVKRRLLAILAADAVGFSRLMASDEEGTAKLLAAHRAVIDGIIEFHEGRIVNTAGDSVIAEFASPVQAVRCAVEIQDALRTRNDSRPEGERLEFRIGVNLGDVIVKGNDLLGDGVNVAARLESITEPGGISVSSSVYDQIAGKLDLGFVDTGNKALKNIDRPVRVYRVERSGGDRGARKPGRSPRVVWAAGGVVMVAVLAGLWQLAWVPTQEASQRALERDQAQRDEGRAKASAEADAARQRADAEAEKARAQAEVARRAAEAESARRTADMDAARRAAEAEAARQRAAAEQARLQADARSAELDEAKRTLQAQRAAEARAREEADLARLRADAEEAKRKAAAELAAAEAIRRKAQEVAAAAPKAAPPPAGQWNVVVNCPGVEGNPARTVSMPAVRQADKVRAEIGTRGEPGWVFLDGTLGGDGSMSFTGNGVSSLPGRDGRTYPASFVVRPSGSGYAGTGRLGFRDCTLTMAPAG